MLREKAPEADPSGSAVLGRPVPHLARLALAARHRQTRNGRGLASCRLSPVLDPEGARGQPGRPVIAREVRDLIRKMCRESPSWGAPRIHGELLKLGVDIGESSREQVHGALLQTAEWTGQQLREAFPFDQPPRYLLRDRDAIFGHEFREQVQDMGIREVLSPPRSPWQRATSSA